MPRPKDSDYSSKSNGGSDQSSVGDHLVQFLILLWGVGTLVIITSI